MRLFTISGDSWKLKAMASVLVATQLTTDTSSKMDSTCSRTVSSLLHLKKQSGRMVVFMTWKLMLMRLQQPGITKKLQSKQSLPLVAGFSSEMVEPSALFSTNRKNRPQLLRYVMLSLGRQPEASTLSISSSKSVPQYYIDAFLQYDILTRTQLLTSDAQSSPWAVRGVVGVRRIEQNILVLSLIQGKLPKLIFWLFSYFTKVQSTGVGVYCPCFLVSDSQLQLNRSVYSWVSSVRFPLMKARAKLGRGQTAESRGERQDCWMGGLWLTNLMKSQMMQVRKMAKKTAVPMRDCLVDTESSLGTGMKEKMSIFLSKRRQMLGCASVIKESRMLGRSSSCSSRSDMFISLFIKYLQQLLENTTLKIPPFKAEAEREERQTDSYGRIFHNSRNLRLMTQYSVKKQVSHATMAFSKIISIIQIILMRYCVFSVFPRILAFVVFLSSSVDSFFRFIQLPASVEGLPFWDKSCRVELLSKVPTLKLLLSDIGTSALGSTSSSSLKLLNKFLKGSPSLFGACITGAVLTSNLTVLFSTGARSIFLWLGGVMQFPIIRKQQLCSNLDENSQK